MRSAEKNDVDLSSLFLWNKEVKIKDDLTNTETTVFIRLIGDRDIGVAKSYSFRRSSQLRRKLKDQDSDEYDAYINNIGDFDSLETLLNAVILFKIQDLADTARKQISVPEPKEPKSDADIEKWEKYQQEVDAYPEKYQQVLREEVDKIIEKEKERLTKLGMEKLYDAYKELVIQRLCSEEVSRAFYEMVVYLCVYKDKDFKKRAFSSIDEFLNVSPRLKTLLLNEYQSLELGMDMLKKLQEATE